MNLQDFKKIFTEHRGCVTPDELEQLAEFAPDLTLGVKVGYGSRFTTTAKNFKLDLENNVKTIYIALDNDALKDALKHAEKLINLGKEVYLVELEGKDPSDIGFEEFTKLLHKATQLTFSQLYAKKIELNYG